MTNAEQARVGIVGLGGMGSFHSDNILDLGHEVVAGADVVPEIREEFADGYDATTYESTDDLYANEDLDAVVVTTPNKFHEPAAVGALEAGIPVLCEKPLAHTLASAERIAGAAEASDAFGMVGFHNRFTTPVTLCKEYVDSGRFGDLTHVEVEYVRRRGIPGSGSWFTNSELSGGGAMIDIGVHALDIAMYLLGFPAVEEVLGITRSNFGGREEYANPDRFFGSWDPTDGVFDVDDSVTALIRCADGTSISLEVSWAAERTPSKSVSLRGTEAGAEFSFDGDSVTLLETDRAGTDHYVDTELNGDREPEGHPAEMDLFLERALAGTPPETNTIEEGLAVQRVIDAIYRSSEDGEAKRLEEPEAESESVELSHP